MIIIFIPLVCFLLYLSLNIFHWCLNDCKFPSISKNILSIIVDFRSASIIPLISYSQSLFLALGVIVPRVPTRILFYCSPHVTQLFQFFGKVCVFVKFLLFQKMSICDLLERQNPSEDNVFTYCLLFWVVWSVSFSTSQEILCVPFSRTDSGLCIHHLSAHLNHNHKSQ